MIPIAKPQIGEEERKAVMAVLDSGIIAQGPKVAEFEKNFAEYIGVKHAIAVSNGTTALHAALLANGIKQGDEVITPAFTFIASSNSVLYCNAKPVFADISEETFNIDPNDILEKITKKTKAIVPVHLYGHPAEMKAIMDIAHDHKLKLIEDACQAHGAEYQGKRVGSFATGCFSFYPTKNMTSSEGGMITTDNDAVAEQCKLLRSHGMPQRYHHSILGYNYRMTDIAAAIGVEQLKKLDSFNNARIRNADYLSKNIKVKGIITPKVQKGCKHVFHQYTIKISAPLTREKVMAHLNEYEIGNMIYYPIPVHKQKLYIDLGYKDKLPVTEKLSEQVLSIPVHPALSSADLKKIAEVINILG